MTPLSSSDTPGHEPVDPLAVQRIRHPLGRRLVQVVRTQLLSPQLVRVTLTGPDLKDFESASFDNHVKVFFPKPGQTRPELPELGPKGFVFEENAPRPTARDYTPRRFDRDALELDIEFVLHGDGPACTWAAQAQPGQYLGIGGPRGSFIIPLAYDWHALIGDETALPAIARRLEELPKGRQALVLLEVADAASEIALASEADVTLRWLHRNGQDAAHSNLLENAARELVLPPGNGYVWVAAEAHAARAVREVMVAQHGVQKGRIRASSYWKQGAQAVHETHED